MKINFNNEKTVDVTLKVLPEFMETVEEKITGNLEHFWIGYKKYGKPVEQKWLRTEYSDADLLKDVEKFMKKALSRKKS